MPIVQLRAARRRAGMAGDLGRAGLTDVHDDHLLIFPGAVGTDPDRLPQQRPGHRVLAALEGHHRRPGRDGPRVTPERAIVCGTMGSRCSRAMLLGEHLVGHPAGHPMHPGVDLHAEHLARRLQLGERAYSPSRFVSFGTRSALASFTVDSDPPLDAGSAGSQVCTVTP